MEILYHLDEDRESGNKTKANEAIYTFVAVDDTEDR
jgi:acyl-CoA hydrolase